MTLVNTSGSTQSANFVTQTFGHPFRKGDIANGCSGGAPIFQLTGGTNVPFSEGLKPICWTDGSLKWAPFMLRVPASIAGNGTLTINILSGGTTPSASGRALSDFATSSTDLNASVTGMDNLSGTWVSDLNQGIGVANTDNYHYMGGQAGDVWRVRASFRQSSANHGQLEAYWYVQSLQDSSGGLYGLRYLYKIAQPWYNVDSPTKNWRSFSAWKTLNGASVLHDFFSANFGSAGAANFTWDGSDAQMNSTANGLTNGAELKLTTTGTLPSGLSTGTVYFASETSAPNTFEIGVDGGGQGTITPTTQCVGTCTATQYPYLTQFGSLFSPGTSSGKPDYIQAGGSSASDNTVRIQFNNTYWRSTKMVPPYLLGTVTPTSTAAAPYFPMTHGVFSWVLEQTGPAPQIGPEPIWAAQHFFNQDAESEQNIRIGGYFGGELPMNMRNNSTFTIPVANNTTYTGMPTANTFFQWTGASGFTSGFTEPSSPNVLISVFDEATFDHMPEFEYYPLLVLGEPQFNDMLVDHFNLAVVSHVGTVGNSAIIDATTNSISGGYATNPGNRDSNINGTQYYGTNWCTTSGLRCQGWTARTMGLAMAIAGGYEPAASQTHQYISDTNTATYAANLQYISLLPTFAQNNGMWFEPNGISHAAWQMAYLLMGTSYTAATNELSNATSFATYLMKWPTFVDSTFGVWDVPYYSANYRPSANSAPSGQFTSNPYLTNQYLFGLGGAFSGQFEISWVNGTSTYTMLSGLENYTPQNGDYVFDQGPNLGGTYPAIFSPFTTYCMVNVSGMTFQLEACPTGTPTGSPLVNTDASTGSFDLVVTPVGHPNTGNANGAPVGNDVMSDVYAGVNWSVAAGSTINPTTQTDINNNYMSGSPLTGWNNFPVFAIGSTY